MRENQERELLRKFFLEWYRYDELVDREAKCKTWDEAQSLYPLMDAFWPKAKKLKKQILKAQATISVIRGKNKKTKQSTSLQRKK